VRLPPVPRLALMVLADEPDDHGFCFPCRRRLAEKCNITERSMRRMIGLLAGCHHPSIEQRFRNDPAPTSNGYQLGVDAPGQIVHWARSALSTRLDTAAKGPGQPCPVTTTYPFNNPKPTTG
jgi:hypothetical protein